MQEGDSEAHSSLSHTLLLSSPLGVRGLCSQLLLGPQGPSLVKGVTPPPLLTDSAGTHLVLTVTKKNTDSPGLASGSPQQVPGAGGAESAGGREGVQ